MKLFYFSLLCLTLQNSLFSSENMSMRYQALTAIKQNNPEALKKILSTGLCVNDKDHFGATILADALSQKSVDWQLIEELIKNDAHLDCQDEIHRTPTYLAAETNNLNFLEYLGDINQTIDYNVPTKNAKWTPIMVATIKGHNSAVIKLINLITKKHGSKKAKEAVNAKDKKGLTALHHAVDFGHIDLVKTLMSERANVNAQDKQLETPLHYVIKDNMMRKEVKIEIIKLLISNGAELLKNLQGDTPWDIAMSNDDLVEIAEIIKKENNKKFIKSKNQSFKNKLLDSKMKK